MNILNFLKGNKQKSIPYTFFVNSGVMSSVVTKSDALDFYKSWVYACVARRSMAIAQLDFKLYKKQGDKVVEIFEHEVLDLLYRVNPQMTKYDFLQLSTIYRDLLGASPWVLEGGKNGKPTTMFIARPEYFKVDRNKNNEVVGYTYEIGNYKKSFSPEQVIFLKNYNPKNPDKGIGLIEAVRTTAQNDDYIVQTNNSLLVNGARPGGYFETEEILDPKERKRVLKQLRSKYGGYDNAFKIQLLEGGLKFKSDLIPPRDLEFIEGRKLNRDEISAIFGVPKALLTSDDVNLANAKSAEYQFNKWTLEPLATQIVEQLNEFLVPKFDDGLWLGFEPIAQEDEDLLLRQKEIGWNKWQTTNEIRESEGKEPIEGGDYIYLPIMNVPAMGRKANNNKDYIKIGGQKKQIGYVDLKTQKYVLKRILNRQFRAKRLGQKAYDNINKGLENKIDSKRVLFKLVEKKNTISPEQIDIFYKDRMLTEDKLEELWKSGLGVFFQDQFKRFLEQVNKLSSQKGVANDIGIDAGKEVKLAVEVIEPLLYQTVIAGVEQASGLIDEPLISNFDFLQDWVKNTSEDLGTQITKTTIESFDLSLREGIQAGEGISDLVKRTQKVFEFASDVRADMIARTETARGITEAHRQTYDYYGFKNVIWLLSPGACEVCREKQQREWTVKTIMGEIPVHPNCKCDFTPISK